MNFEFPRGNCLSYTDSDALVCSAAVYEGTENFGRECYHFNGENYRLTGYTKYGHNRGAMVTYLDSVHILGGKGVLPDKKEATSNLILEYFYKYTEDEKVYGGWKIRDGTNFGLRKGRFTT